MNYFAHGLRFLGEPYLLAGTAVPDWLSVIDRRARISSRSAGRFIGASDPRTAAVATGIVQHHHDDEWFHRTAAFAELSLEFAQGIRELLAGDDGFRPSFLGHILVEILLDAALGEERPDQLVEYYARLDSLDPQAVCRAVGQMATRAVPQLEDFIPRFSAERFLYDYADDGKLLKRLNRVLVRVGLSPLPEPFCEFLPRARRRVQQRKSGLLDDAKPRLAKGALT